jgi:hypothetical protein
MFFVAISAILPQVLGEERKGHAEKNDDEFGEVTSPSSAPF